MVEPVSADPGALRAFVGLASEHEELVRGWEDLSHRRESVLANSADCGPRSFITTRLHNASWRSTIVTDSPICGLWSEPGALGLLVRGGGVLLLAGNGRLLRLGEVSDRRSE